MFTATREPYVVLICDGVILYTAKKKKRGKLVGTVLLIL